MFLKRAAVQFGDSLKITPTSYLPWRISAFNKFCIIGNIIDTIIPGFLQTQQLDFCCPAVIPVIQIFQINPQPPESHGTMSGMKRLKFTSFSFVVSVMLLVLSAAVAYLTLEVFWYGHLTLRQKSPAVSKR